MCQVSCVAKIDTELVGVIDILLHQVPNELTFSDLISCLRSSSSVQWYCCYAFRSCVAKLSEVIKTLLRGLVYAAIPKILPTKLT